MQNSRNEELTAEKKRKIDRKNKNFKRKKKRNLISIFISKINKNVFISKY